MSAVAGVCSTLSKSPALFPSNAPPTLISAQGSRVFGSDGQQFTDWIAGLLAVMLGHKHPEVNENVRRHIDYGGPTWSLAHELEERVAARILGLTDDGSDRQVRFFKTGSEACSAAIRVARAVTGRDVIVSSGYHGWHDTALTADPAWGVPRAIRALTRTFPFNDLEAAENPFFSLDALGRDDDNIGPAQIAAIIVEPETLEKPAPGFLEGLKALCTRFGALLIFDECITGGRHAEFTAARRYGVQPDLLVLSKCLANGWPLAATVSKRAIMECFDADWSPGRRYPATHSRRALVGPVYCSGTYSGETASLAAADATLRIWERDDVALRISQIGSLLREGANKAIQDMFGEQHRVLLRGPNYRLVIDVLGDDGKTDYAALTLVKQELIRRGTLVGAGFNPMAAHSRPDVDNTLRNWDSALEILRIADRKGGVLERIGGRVVAPPYRQG